MNSGLSKQYMENAGKPVLAWTLERFEECSIVDEVVLVINEQDFIYCKQNIIDEFELCKVKALVAGGAERQNSVYNGLLEVSSECGIVIIHDGARPFVSEKIIRDSIAGAAACGACGVAVPVKDTIKIAGQDGFVLGTPDRNSLWAIQTPQTFKYSIIMDAHRRAISEGFTGTDDAVLVERLGMKMKLVMGSYDNIKITTKEDLVIAEAIAEYTGI